MATMSTITVDQLISSIESCNGYPLNESQKKAIRHSQGPLWIIAGPGTGKTEVLVSRCLRLLCCDGIDPKSILVTTFTEKAAMSLQQRIHDKLTKIIKTYPQLINIDPSGLRLGTLHALCNEILQEYRYEPYRNLRLLDDIESKMLFRGEVADFVQNKCPELISEFRFLFSNKPNLNQWDITKGMISLVNRIVEDDLDGSAIRTGNQAWQQVLQSIDKYDNALKKKYACDFARLQKHFLTFLTDVVGHTFLNGDNVANKPPLLYVLVDEYQDTNPIQEKIYFALANQGLHNITVVGDDDQALYRFRGGSVECMVGFGDTCKRIWGIIPTSIQLRENYRSHHTIVNYCEQYISQWPQMNILNARAPDKQPLIPASGKIDNYPAVGFIAETNMVSLASSFATTINGLKTNKIIDDFSQCVLLLMSTKEGPRGAGPYIDALIQQNIPFYNPRSKAFAERSEVIGLLGTLISVLDPGLLIANTLKGPDLIQMVQGCVTEYHNMVSQNPALSQYVQKSNQKICKLKPKETVTEAIPTILYRILTFPPFPSYQQDVEKDLRISKVTRLLEAFCAHYGRKLKMDDKNNSQVNNYWLSQFYYVFCGYLSVFGIDDDEDDEVICPQGRVPIMTIHQSKGLEFDFVFVGTLGRNVSVDNAIQLEEKCRSLRLTKPTIIHSTNEMAWHDDIRSHYVAYSRAKEALILLGTKSQFRKKGDETASFGHNGGIDFYRSYIKL